jgi:hypothetical protein
MPDRGGKPTVGGDRSKSSGADIESKGALIRAKETNHAVFLPFPWPLSSLYKNVPAVPGHQLLIFYKQ